MFKFKKASFPLVYILFFLLALSHSAQANISADTLANDSTTKTKNRLLFVPVPFYYPETRFGLAVGGLYTFRPKGVLLTDRPSQIQAGGGYTQNKQVLSYINTQIYTKNQGYVIFTELGYYRYFFPFNGIGYQQEENYSETYSVKFPRIKSAVYKQVKPNLFFGVKLHFDNFNITGRAPGGLLEEHTITGSDGGRFFMWGIGGNYDTRDNYFSAQKGVYIDYAIQTSTDKLISDFNFQHFYVNASRYIPVSKKLTLGLNLYSDNFFGNVPFFEMAYLGGAKNLRGFYEGEIRDKHSLAFNTELRYRFLPRFAIVGFGGVGSVAPSLDKLLQTKLPYAYGAGLRVVIDPKERLNFRIDYGLNSYGKGKLYVTFFEAF